MPKSDYGWLMEQSRDKQTKMFIREIEHDRILAEKEKKIIKGDYFIKLNLGDYGLLVRKCSAYVSADIYTEIFKDNGHAKIPGFSGKGNNVILDIGANEGFYLLKMKQDNPEAKIIAVEPNPASFEVLQKNIEYNGIKNAVLENRAITRRKGIFSFQVVKEVGAICALNIDIEHRPWLKKSRIRKIRVSGITLEDLCRSQKLDSIDLMKIDAEGAEMDILTGGASVLPYINRIVVEYHSPQLREQVKKFLMAKKFRLLLEEKGKGPYGELYFIHK